MPLQDIAERIADQQHLDAGRAGGCGEGRVVAGQHDDLLAVLLETAQSGEGDISHQEILVGAPKAGAGKRCL
ncbi:hypothetical protein D3C76_1816450 [compost metagenome]